ncbi:uncharacterized protein LOC121391428 isoform X2 [Gigantopelta aegis]|uniref:uncharacterized protein LOC121391428 isoform X2 n=1 Tax=Gigantopelta aegis TaxID=1735272 RepID=UPI001B88B7FB|nr:uncharacterized protein LOC121391428 isoform X2 [Gigantopelta aegis]
MKSVFLTLDVVVLWVAVVVQGDGDELANTTWYKATQACRKRGEELYHSTDKSHVARFLDRNSGKHWIGAKVMYSSWTWTEDRSTLFKYEGYRNVTEEDKHAKIFWYRNQAVRCYTECNTKYIGLQGTKCFCVQSPNLSPENTAQDRCWGNSQEYCGTEHGMSVYKAEYGLLSDDIMEIKTEKQCQAKKYGRVCICTGDDSCEDGVMVYANKLNWTAANQSCPLINLSGNDVSKAVYDSIHVSTSHWIGLSRYRYIGWIARDGTIGVPDTGKNGCVWAERLGNGSLVFGVTGCATSYKIACTEGTIPIRTSPDSTSDQSYTTSTAPDTDRVTVPLADTHAQSDGPVIGGSLAALAVIVLVLLLLAVVWMKRTKRVCFKDKAPDSDTRHVTSNQNVYELSDDRRVESTYCHINDRPDETDADSQNNRNGRRHYEFEQESAEAQLGVSGAKDEPYELAMDPREVNADGEGDYDELHDSRHNKVQQWSGSDTYSHINDRDGRGGYDTYDRTNSVKDIPPLDATYSHIHSNRGVDDANTYDSAAPVEVVPAPDTTYSHVVPSTLGNE